MTDTAPGAPAAQDRQEEGQRERGVTLWRHIMRTLEQEIGDGTYPPGGKLPTEAELSARFSVNRHTVRRALEELSRMGMVRVEQGRGTFAAETVLDYAVTQRTRFSEVVRGHNREPSGKVLSLREIAADAAVAAGLGVRPHARVVCLERLGFADERPVGLSTHYFPQLRFPDIIDVLRTENSVTEALRRCGVPDYRRMVTRVSARLPTPRETELLRTARNRPVLLTENVNVDAAGLVVEFGLAIHPTPRVQLVFEP